jgi:hypothetical protein
MATERQIAANRANAGKSTGPRSRAGRKRASANATVHGLGTPLVSPAVAQQVEALARRITEDTDDIALLRYARDVARAELDLAQVRRIKVALVARASLVVTSDDSARPDSLGCLRKALYPRRRDEQPRAAPRSGGLASALSVEQDGGAAAVRVALPELVKLARYESRAAARRERAFRQITLRLAALQRGQNP